MTLGIIVHAGDFANFEGKQALVERFSPAIYVTEVGYGQNVVWEQSRPWISEGLYRMQPKDPNKQLERVLDSFKEEEPRDLIVRLIEFPLAEQGDYALKISRVLNPASNVSICSPINYFASKDSITHRLIGFLNHTLDLVPIIRLTADESIMAQNAKILSTLLKEDFPVSPCLQIIGGEQLTNDQIDTYCARVLAASSKLYLWSIGTVAGNPIAERIMQYMNDTYPEEKHKITLEPFLSPKEKPVAVVQKMVPGILQGTVAVPDLSVRKDSSLSAKIVSSMNLGERVAIQEVVQCNPDLSFAHLENGYWAVQHWSGVDYILLDDADDKIK